MAKTRIKVIEVEADDSVLGVFKPSECEDVFAWLKGEESIEQAMAKLSLMHENVTGEQLV